MGCLQTHENVPIHYRYEERLKATKDRLVDFKKDGKAIKKETSKLRKDVKKEVKKIQRDTKSFMKVDKKKYSWRSYID